MTEQQLGAHIFLCMYVCIYLFILIFVCLFFVCMHLNAVAMGGQRHEIPLKLELKVVLGTKLRSSGKEGSSLNH